MLTLNPRTTAGRGEISETFRSSRPEAKFYCSNQRGVVLRARARGEKMITGAGEIYLQQPCFVSIGCYVR